MLIYLTLSCTRSSKMTPSFKDAITICKSIMRNGYDAHIINTPLQHEILLSTGSNEIDLATDMPYEELTKLFSNLEDAPDKVAIGILEQNNYIYRFYKMTVSETAHPENVLTRLTPTILSRMRKLGPIPPSLISGMSTLLPAKLGKRSGFVDFDDGYIRFEGLPDETLRADYLLGIRALRYAANYDLPIEPNTWMAIVRGAQRILDYLPTQKIMEEWRMVDAENMWRFVELLFDSQILHGFIPELAGLSRVHHARNDSGEAETVLAHTISCVRCYPKGKFNYDWIGTLAMLFHDVGKLYTAEVYNGTWYFYQHHRVGAEVTRKILRRLHMMPEDIELICHLVHNHMRFQFMMTDRGIRKFMAQDDNARLIEMSRANIEARDDNYTAFNHNHKYLERAETPEQMLEPLLNGNEIMEITGIKPGPHVGDIRKALLQAQVEQRVNDRDDAIKFTKEFAKSI